MRQLVRLGFVALGLALLIGACGGADEAAPTSTEAVVVGEGKLPDTVPSGFPIPASAVIGSTLIDHVGHRTEFRLTMGGALETTVRYFEVGLVNQGYVITSSEGSASEWTLRFSSGELAGSIVTSAQPGNVSTALISLNTS